MPVKVEYYILSYIFKKEKRWWFEKCRSDIVRAINDVNILQYVDRNICPVCFKHFKKRMGFMKHVYTSPCSKSIMLMVKSISQSYKKVNNR